jgi:hypothetical protein
MAGVVVKVGAKALKYLGKKTAKKKMTKGQYVGAAIAGIAADGAIVGKISSDMNKKKLEAKMAKAATKRKPKRKTFGEYK